MRNKIIILIAFVIIFTSIPFYGFVKNHSEAYDFYAENGIKSELSKEINILIVDELNKSNDDYINVTRKKDGTIDYISVDTVKVNKFANNMSEMIYDCIYIHEGDFQIPLGNAIGIKILSERGPKIKFNVSHLNTVSYKLNSELISSGINQTLHRVSIVFETEINCAAPFYEKSTMIKNEIIISEILLIGSVPEIVVSPVGN